MFLVYTDGGKRRETGAWAYVVIDASPSTVADDYCGRVSGRILSYGYGAIPNLHSSAQAELVAALSGIVSTLNKFSAKELCVVSDSTYVTNGLKNPFRMERNNERYAKYWRELVPICAFNRIDTRHVRGHKQQSFNSFVDWICHRVLEERTDRIKHAVHLFNNSGPWRKAVVRTHK